MTDRLPDDRHPSPQGGDDRTRDIRLPPLPGSAPAALRPEWSAAAQPAPPIQPVAPEVPPSPPMVQPAALQVAPPEPDPVRNHEPIDDEPTDHLPPPASVDRQRTLTFDSPPPDLGAGNGQPPFGSPATAGPAPVRQPSAPAAARPADRPDPGSRKWPWVLLVLLPLLVIAGAGLLLFFLLGG